MFKVKENVCKQNKINTCIPQSVWHTCVYWPGTCIYFLSVCKQNKIHIHVLPYVFLEKTFSLIPYIPTILIFAGFSRFYIVINTNPNIPIGITKITWNSDSQYRYIVTVHFDPIYLSQVTNIASRNKGSYFSTSTKLSPI